ncbi:MAG: hypothetical protein HC927_12640, partial [Deltaproteobacteria bacterium]|nr:hypothetical protein [Deltaproteobacteria bacterium]
LCPPPATATPPTPGGYRDDLRFRWYHSGGYFDTTISPTNWAFISDAERQPALDQAAAAQYRLIGVWPLLWLGFFEKVVFLQITLAQGLSFISFSVAVIFAFFKRTEAIARSVVDLWIEILITRVVIALAQALIVARPAGMEEDTSPVTGHSLPARGKGRGGVCFATPLTRIRCLLRRLQKSETRAILKSGHNATRGRSTRSTGCPSCDWQHAG